MKTPTVRTIRQLPHVSITEASGTAEVIPVNAEALMRPEQLERRANNNGNVIYAGTEYLGTLTLNGPAGVGATYPAGSTLYHISLNPFLWDGSRIQKEAAQFSQYRIHRMRLEFKSSVPPASTSIVGQFQAFFVDDIADSTSLYVGDAAIRAGYARPNGCVFQAWQNAACDITKLQQKSYYVSPDGMDPHLSYPGAFQIVSNTSISVAASTSLVLGTIAVHFEVEFYTPAIADPSAFTFSAFNSKINFSGVAESVAADAAVPTANIAGLAGSAYQDIGVICWATIAAVDDGSLGTTGWRTFRSPDNGDSYTLAPGMTIYFRWNDNGYWYFYPSHAAACGGIGVTNFSFTVTATNGGTAGLWLNQIMAESLRKG